METKKEYIAPELTVVTFRTERGYASSSPNPLAVLQILNAFTGLSGGNIETFTFDQTDQTFDGSGFSWE